MKAIVDAKAFSLALDNTMEYFIYMTNDCNLHCQYCSVLLDCKKTGLPIKPNYSNSALASFIVKTQEKCDDREVNIYFFGGEPTMEYHAIERLVQDLRLLLSDDLSLRFVLHTNGLLLNRIPKTLLDKLSLIMFSINYEKIPKFNLANSYFSTIITNAIATKRQRDIPMIARLTITEQTSLYTEVLQVLSFFDLVYWQIENCSKFKNFAAFFDTYTFEIERTFDYWLQYLEHGFMIKLVPFMAVLKFMFYPDRSDEEFSCGYSRGMIYVQTDGNCYACSDNVEGGAHYMGSITSGVTLGRRSLSEFRCAHCNYRRLCMGRCGRMHIEFSEDHISEYCKLNQFMFNMFLTRKRELEQILQNHPQYQEELSSCLLEYTEFTP